MKRILGKSIQDYFFGFFGLFGFSRGFFCPKPNCSKIRGKPKKIKKNKKINPVRRILGKSIQDWFFWFIWFFSRFLLYQAQLSKNSRKPKNKNKNKKTNPVKRILGKSIQDYFFWFIWFFSSILLSQAQLSKNLRKTKKLKKTILWEESWVSPFRIVFFDFFGLFGFSRGFFCPKPNYSKIRGNQKNQKKIKKTILWEESWVSQFRIGFFGLFGFSRGFCCSKPNCSKIGGNRIIYMERRKRYIYISKGFSLRNRLSNYLLKRSWV